MLVKGDTFHLNKSDERIFNFRGINLDASSKTPTGWKFSSKVNWEDVPSFEGTPFETIHEAEEHIKRIKYWGFTIIRFIVTWEALEPKLPGIYDSRYINYLLEIFRLFNKYSLKCFIDPHQDCWSRFSGGSGAPLWTLYLAGLNPKSFKETLGAANIYHYDNPYDFPEMCWPTNYSKLACMTMFTLFFGGKTFFPKCVLNVNKQNIHIQDFLQDSFIQAYQNLASNIKNADLSNIVVIGFETINEPSKGLIGHEDLNCFSKEFFSILKINETPKPYEAIKLGNAIETKVSFYAKKIYGFTETCKKLITPHKKIWLESIDDIPRFMRNKLPQKKFKGCIYALHNIWDPETVNLINKQYFSVNPKTGNKIYFENDFWKPFVIKYTNAIRSVDEDYIMFIQPPVCGKPFDYNLEKSNIKAVVTPHWYDCRTLILSSYSDIWNFDCVSFVEDKSFSAYFKNFLLGRENIKRTFRKSIESMKKSLEGSLGKIPLLIGECGIPFDLDKLSFINGDYSSQVKAMQATLEVVETSLSNSTIWNYTYNNTHREGDIFNHENLSIFSLDDYNKTEPIKNFQDSKFYLNSLDFGGRALEALVKPYAILTPGTILKQEFKPAMLNNGSSVYTLQFKLLNKKEYSSDNTLQCEIFLPIHHYRKSSTKVRLNKGEHKICQKSLMDEIVDFEDLPELTNVCQYLLWSIDQDTKHDYVYEIVITNH